MLEFLFLTCVTSASLLPLDPTSAASRRGRSGHNFAYAVHEPNSPPVLANPAHALVAAKPIPHENINPVSFLDPAVAGYVQPVPYSYGAHPPFVQNPSIGLPEGGPITYEAYRYPVVEVPHNYRIH